MKKLAIILTLLALPALAQTYQLEPNGYVLRDGATWVPPSPGNRDWQNYQSWLAAGNTPLPLPTPSAADVYVAAINAGIQITSTSTPALNGTYALAGDAKTNVSAIYAGIKSGDGLPGGGTSFNYPDASGAPHSFNATTFTAFALAVRNYLYALSQGQAPSQPVTIP